MKYQKQSNFTIISILLTMPLPVPSKAREKAKATQCISNLKQYGIGMNFYMDDNREWLMNTWQKYVGGTQANNYDYWFYYLSRVSKYMSPKFDHHCPTQSALGPGKNYYQMNTLNHLWTAADNTREHYRPNWRKPAQKLLVADGIYWESGANYAQWTWYPISASTQSLDPRHGGKVNILYMDAHVAPFDFRQKLNGVTDYGSWVAWQN